MSAATYTRLELRRSLRNRRFFLFSLGFPVVFYVVIVLANGRTDDFAGTGISSALFYLTGLASFGCMAAMIGGGARIAAERANGWNRQLRITPLKARTYFTSKVLVSYVICLMTIVLLTVFAVAFGARLSVLHWLEMTALVLIGVIPFAGIGIGLGHLLSSDALGPVLGTSVGLLAFLGGTWFPVTGGLKSFSQFLPSYWIAQAAHTAVGGAAWSAFGWGVIAVWSVAGLALAVFAYRHDTKRA